MIKIYHGGFLNPVKIAFTLIGILGLLFLISIPFSGPEMAIPGILLTLAFFPAMYRTGIEIDSENRRIRFIEGTLGNTKNDWINIEDDDYLSAVLFSATQGGGLRGNQPNITTSQAKIYLFQNDGHQELYSGDGDDVTKHLKTLSTELGLRVNDVRGKQDESQTSSGGFGHY